MGGSACENGWGGSGENACDGETGRDGSGGRKNRARGAGGEDRMNAWAGMRPRLSKGRHGKERGEQKFF